MLSLQLACVSLIVSVLGAVANSAVICSCIVIIYLFFPVWIIKTPNLVYADPVAMQRGRKSYVFLLGLCSIYHSGTHSVSGVDRVSVVLALELMYG